VRTAIVLGAIVVAALATGPTAASAAGTTYVAGPSGSGSECTSLEPCSLAEAVHKAVGGDTVRLNGGIYSLPFSGVRIDEEIDFGGSPGAPAVIETTVAATIAVAAKANASLHDLHLVGRGPLILESGSADRVFVDYTGLNAPVTEIAACELSLGTTLRDSVCWAREAGESTAAHAIEVVVSGEGLKGTAFLRNDTAIAGDAGGSGLYVQAGFGARFSVNAEGLIAQSRHSTDVTAALVGASVPEAHVALTHSSYATIGETLPYAEVTPPGTDGNQTAAPAFVNAAAGDFHQAPGSPTIDGALADSHTGTLDLEGHPRSQPGCLGGGSAPDIGAFERTATSACPPPPPEPTPPKEPPKPVFRIVKVTVHGAGGSVQIETPGAGTLTLTGLGVKLVRRSAPAAGVVTMPIRPWAITRVRLNSAGKARVRLKVTFAPTSGIPHERARTVLLRKG
jgi:hypothetical protein